MALWATNFEEIVIFIVLLNSELSFLGKKYLHLCEINNFYFQSVHIQKLQKIAQHLHSSTIKFVFSTVKLYKFIRNFISEFLITYPDKGYHKHQTATDCSQITMRKNSKSVKYVHNGC